MRVSTARSSGVLPQVRLIMAKTALTEMKKHLRPGKVYRREDLAKWCTSVDRQLKTRRQRPFKEAPLRHVLLPEETCFWRSSPQRVRTGSGISQDRPLCRDFAESLQPTRVGYKAALQQAGRLQPKTNAARLIWVDAFSNLNGAQTSLGSCQRNSCSWISLTTSISLPRIEIPF